jgi:hypothetical protein
MTERAGAPNVKKDSNRATWSLLAGLALVPLSAVAAFALVSPSERPGGNDVEYAAADLVATSVATAPTTAARGETVVVVEPATATRADLEAACGPDGQALVEREYAGDITPVEQAALDALRQICEAEGLVLAGPPAPPDVVRTVRVKAPPPPSAAISAAGATELAESPQAGGHEEEDDDDDRGSSSAAEYAAAHASAQTAIEQAVAAGGDSGKIEEAREQLAKAEHKADRGNYSDATSKAREAQKKAKEALHESDDD